MPVSNLAYTTENIILVDPEDNQIGTIEKILAHEYGMLHRAFSVFLFRKRFEKLECLLQQRSIHKYHAGGLWTNACCSHPHIGETIIESAEKRLQFEMGIQATLIEIGCFHYIAQFDNGLTENEMDHVLIGYFDSDDILVNPDEVDDFKWVEVTALQHLLASDAKVYTPWFQQALEIALKSTNQKPVYQEH